MSPTLVRDRPVMNFVCSKHEQTKTRNAQLPWKALLLAKTEITKRTSTHARTRLHEGTNIC